MATIWLQGGTVLSASSAALSTPTPDRLAKPTVPAEPSQADYGAQVFWLYCMPCHGDRGQGLTGEFRQIYPPEDQNCWTSGCHGKRPYTNGFTLPTVVPPLIGPGALNKFATAAGLHGFISNAMPFQAPGTLDDKLYWQVIAFLLRQNGLWNGPGEVDASNAAQILIQPAAALPSATPGPAAPGSGGSSAALLIVAIGLAVLILAVFLISQRQAKI